MSYIDFEYYKTLYKDSELAETDFGRLLWDAEREIDKATSGVDNVKKLRIAFPIDAYDAETVKRSVCALIDLLHQIEIAEKTANSSRGYIERVDGTIQGKVVTSVSAGNESISFSANSGVLETNASIAAKGVKEKSAIIKRVIENQLSGVVDANGVNLLYMGRYPYFAKNNKQNNVL